MGTEYTEPKISRISVGGQPVGMRNLEQVFDIVRKRTIFSENEIKRALLEESRNMKNYIPPSAEAEYQAALLREYRRHLGDPVADDEPQGLIVKVLGRGCPQCTRLTQEVMAALSDLNLGADVEHITDINEIAEYGAIGTPALVVNKEIKSVGRVPQKEQIKTWLQIAAQQTKP